MTEQKLIIFDLDGTLVDTVALVVNSMNLAFEELGHITPTEEEIRSISGLRLDIAINQLAPDLDENQTSIIGEKYRQIYLSSASSSNQEALFVGALDALEELNRRNDMLLAIATGKPLLSTKRILQAHNIIDIFTSLQTPDNNASKPNPEMIFSAMSVVGAQRDNIIMIGDTTHDMNMANAADVKSIGVGWGYHTKQDLLSSGASTYIDRFDDLIDTIDGFDNA